MRLHNFGCDRNDINQAVASSLGTENRTDTRLMKNLFVIPRLHGSQTSGSSAKHSFLHIRKAPGSNPSWNSVIQVEFLAVFASSCISFQFRSSY